MYWVFTFNFNSLHFNTDIWTFYSLHFFKSMSDYFSCNAFEGNYQYFFVCCVIAQWLPNVTGGISTFQHIWCTTDITRRKQTERETQTGRRGVLVSHICWNPAALSGFSYFLNSLLCSGKLYLPKMSISDILRKRLNNQLPFWCVHEQPGQILPIQTPDLIVH